MTNYKYVLNSSEERSKHLEQRVALWKRVHEVGRIRSIGSDRFEPIDRKIETFL